MRYAELFCQSNFSFLQGASHPEELIKQADFLAYDALAICDECSVAGVVRAYRAIKDNKLSIKLIVGSFFKYQSLQFVLLSPNRQAYAELCRVISNARKRCDKGRYELNLWDILSVKQCFIIWLPAFDEQDAHWAAWLKQYHQGRVWLGVQRHLNHHDKAYILHCQQLAKQYSLVVTACGGVLMHVSERQKLQHTLTAIRHNCAVSELGEKLLSNTERALRSKVKLSKLFSRQWLDTACDIAARCTFDLGSLRYEYPSELVPQGHSAMSYLYCLVNEGKQLRFPDGVPDDIEALIEKELLLIEQLNYPYFFLTIHDVVMFAKRQGILYQGRGSAANSVVCYCLQITAVDPRQISVLFERFISQERNEPPDIDVDFEHHRREEVIQYIYQKYGRERAALAATVISYRFKSAVRDVGKALAMDSTQLDYFVRQVNRRDKLVSWQSQLSELGLDANSYQGQLFIELVNEILGFPRHLSQHVGGFVISSGPLYELVPIENAAMEARTVIQWDKDDLESLSLLKVDILALGMLSAIRKSFDSIAQHFGYAWNIADITRLGDDSQVYGMLQKADTVGVFQVESRAQMSMLPRLKPACYYDLVIQIAIVRPGPIQGKMVHPFLQRRAGEQPVSYPSDDVESVLSRTLGVPIFQEQVIKLAMVAAGFSGGEADRLRRAMASWKKTGELWQFKDKLLNGMQQRGYTRSYAEQIFAQICGFGEYGFPESHSASFAVLAYSSAWLKYYFPAFFYTALLNSLPMGFYSASQLCQDAQRHGIAILPVCVNASQLDHEVVQSKHNFAIRLGLRMIKGLKARAIKTLLAHRPEGGYKNIQQLSKVGVDSCTMELLASGNALACFSDGRYSARWQLMNKDVELPLFANSGSPEVPTVAPLGEGSELDNMLEDYAVMGLTLHKHPITLLDEAGRLGRFTRMAQLSGIADQQLVTVIGVVTGKQAPGTAAGVTFFTLEDDTGNINVVVWSATARAQKQAYLSAKILEVKGVLERSGEVIHVIAGRLLDRSDLLRALKSDSRQFH
ncbi:error-prone DNA polymerase [Pseudoalteromonas byunsanensis]|uniref:Error-prone DNA polymerase n=1 Tax=Pseudoalteromonas byunsanensis TaxID=327939 RepID=A0A1S1NAW4_9GAMM|nr:error-prone DNA polymerase [Pseudoalteromonas byunsanensis]OHU96670.1 error-prone DNA polymerase [Pseudoalteromonas byunsanensis]